MAYCVKRCLVVANLQVKSELGPVQPQLVFAFCCFAWAIASVSEYYIYCDIHYHPPPKTF